MPLEKTTIDIPLTSGESEKLDDVFQLQDAAKSSINIRHDKIGRAEMRPGTVALTATTLGFREDILLPAVTPVLTRITEFKDVIIGDGDGFTSVYESGSDRWISMGAHIPSSLVTRPMARDIGLAANNPANVFTKNGFTVMAWNGSSGKVVTNVFHDAADALFLTIESTLTPATTPLVIAPTGGDNIFIYVVDSVGNDIEMAKMDTAGPGYGGFTTTSIAGMSRSTHLSGFIDSDGNAYVVGQFVDGSSNDFIRIYSVNATTGALTQVYSEQDTTGLTGTGASAAVISAHYHPGRDEVIITYLDAPNSELRALVVDVDGWTSVVAITVLETGITSPVTTAHLDGQSATARWRVYWSDTSTGYTYTRQYATSNLASFGTILTLYNLALRTTAAYAETEHPVMWFYSNPSGISGGMDLTPKGSYVLGSIRVINGVDDTFFVYGQAFYERGHVEDPLVHMFSNTAGLQAALVVDIGPIGTDEAEFHDVVYKVEPTNTSGKRVQFRDMSVAAGAATFAFDGASHFEIGFLESPTISQVTTSNGAGSLANSGVYSWAYYWQWIDDNGRIHRSQPAFSSSTTMGASDDTAVLQLRPLTATMKRNGVTLKVFRTLNGGTVYYSLENSTNNSTAAATIAYTDLQADATISSNPTLYTSGGALGDRPPPPSTALATYNDRLVISEAGTNLVWIQNANATDSEKEFLFPGFNALSLVSVGDTDAITAMEQMDSNLIVFTERDAYAISGPGPGRTGAPLNLSTPSRISASRGCESVRSTVLTELGLMFKSLHGIYLLDRSLQMQYVGAGIDDLRTNTVLGTAIDRLRKEVYFAFTDVEIAVFSFGAAKPTWSRWNYPHGAVKDVAVDKSGNYYYAEAALVYKGRTSDYRDASTTQTMTYRTEWVRQRGVEDYLRVYAIKLRGTKQSACTVTMKLYYNYDETTVGQTVVFTPTESNGETMALRVRPARQKCKAFAVQIEVVGTGGTYQGAHLHNLAARLGFKRGQLKTAAANSK